MVSIISSGFQFVQLAGTARSTILQVLSFLLIIIRSSGRDKVMCLYVKISGEFARLIFQDRFYFVHISLVRIVKLQFLAQFPVGQLTHPAVSSLSVLICCIRLWCDWSFRLSQCITYICCFVTSYIFLLWYGWSIWYCFELLLEVIQFLS